MNLAAELFLTAFGIIMGIVVVSQIIAKLFASKDEEGEV